MCHQVRTYHNLLKFRDSNSLNIDLYELLVHLS